MTRRRPVPARPPLVALGLLLPLLLALLLGACSGGGQDSDAGASSTPTPSATPTPAAPPPAAPTAGACYRLGYAQAIAPTSAVRTVRCRSDHTSTTYAVGRLRTTVDGHLLAVDSQRVRDQVAEACPKRFAAFVGGSDDDRRLSMLRPVWFTPTVEQADAGAAWYRCDVVALARTRRLAPLEREMRGVLDSDEGRDRYGMCGTAAPGTAHFQRVICSGKHAWRAISVVPVDGKRYPGVKEARAAGQAPCRDAGAGAADDSLDYQWGYEWPTAEQWADGQHYGICWAPDS